SVGLLFMFAITVLPSASSAQADKSKPAEFKPYTETIPGSKVAFEMVPIPAGTFTMGSPATEKDRKEDEGPQHPVQIAAFWMAKFETTWDAYDLYRFDENVPKGDKKDNRPAVQAIVTADAMTRPTPTYDDETYHMPREGHPCLAITHHA